MFPWSGAAELKARTINRARTFLKRHQTASEAKYLAPGGGASAVGVSKKEPCHGMSMLHSFETHRYAMLLRVRWIRFQNLLWSEAVRSRRRSWPGSIPCCYSILIPAALISGHHSLISAS